MKSPSPLHDGDYLWDVASISSQDAWAVGEFGTPESEFLTLAEHWDGRAWTAVRTPNVGSLQNVLRGVSAVSSTDVWAAGYSASSLRAKPMVQHWDGTAWTVVPSPSLPGLSGGFLGIEAIASDDVWAVGDTESESSPQGSLIEHWDGTRWSIVDNPTSESGAAVLQDVAAVSATDVWAVGYFTTQNYTTPTLIEHWDGSRWSVVPSPSPQPGNLLQGVTAVSSDDVWAVGSAGSGPSGVTLVEHWDGTAWSVVPSPNPDPVRNDLNAVASNSASDIWAVGYYETDTEPHRQQTLSEHWDGTSWSIVPGPDVGTDLAQLWGVATGPKGDVWAVGVRPDPTYLGELTLTEHYC